MKYTKTHIELLKIGAPMMTWGIMLENYMSALEEIERLQSENAWIPVSERLPETNKRIELFGGFEQTTHIGYRRESADQWESENGSFWHGQNYGLITHWRPLPQPPESEG